MGPWRGGFGVVLVLAVAAACSSESTVVSRDGGDDDAGGRGEGAAAQAGVSSASFDGATSGLGGAGAMATGGTTPTAGAGTTNDGGTTAAGATNDGGSAGDSTVGGRAGAVSTGGDAGAAGAGACVPRTCDGVSAQCGPLVDGCGTVLNCGQCDEPRICGIEAPGVCGDPPCVPTTCAEAGVACGPLGDGCGGELHCGTCTAPETCGGGGSAGVCGCTPASCPAGACGELDDGCGGTLECGGCDDGETCGGAAPNVCGTAPCVPTTCAAEGVQCGSLSDGCDTLLHCGTCAAPESCGGGGDAGVCGCTPRTCEPDTCGPVDDGCGGTLDCGGCGPWETCGGGGADGVCGCAADVLALCARGHDGIYCATQDDHGAWARTRWSSDFTDDQGYRDLARASTLRFPDVNGDGHADACARSGIGVDCALGDGHSGFHTATRWVATLRDQEGWGDPDHYGTVDFADLDGDGCDDVCARGGIGMQCALSLACRADVTRADAFGPLTQWRPELSDANGYQVVRSWGTIQLFDRNLDGMADLCGLAPGAGLVCAESNGTIFADFRPAQSAPASGPYPAPNLFADYEEAHNWGTILFPDITGDGLPDVCSKGGTRVRGACCKDTDFQYRGGIRCAFGTAGGARFENESWVVYESFATMSGWDSPASWGTLQFADINGDGRDDLCGRSAGGMRCSLATTLEVGGTGSRPGLTTSTNWTTDFSDARQWGADPSYWATIRLVDVNGDGRADVCGRGGQEGYYCRLSDGANFRTAVHIFPQMTDAAGWAAHPSYWGTARWVTVKRGTCRPTLRRSGSHPWGSSAVAPRQ